MAKWLFKLLFPDKGEYTTVGDLDEVFHHLASEGRVQARFWYWRQAIKAIPSYFDNLVYWSTIPDDLLHLLNFDEGPFPLR